MEGGSSRDSKGDQQEHENERHKLVKVKKLERRKPKQRPQPKAPQDVKTVEELESDRKINIEGDSVPGKDIEVSTTSISNLGSEKFFSCPKCCKYYSQSSHEAFQAHLSECSVKKRHPCPTCGRIFTTRNVLTYHIANVHENPHPKSKLTKTRREARIEANAKTKKMRKDEVPVPDNINEMSFQVLPEAGTDVQENWPETADEANELGISSGLWKCWICFYSSKLKKLWQTHVSRIHSDILGISLNCDFCGFSFTKNFHLREHLNEAHVEETGFKCKDCDRKFVYKNAKHDCEVIACEICQEKFNTKGQRTKHLLTHDDFKPFQCNICPKKFQKKEYLSVHTRVHKDERPYTCSFCNQKFRIKSHLNNHRRLHTGEKPYICPTCQCPFVSPQSLVRHQMTHSIQKGFACAEPLCGREFRSTNDLRRHSLIHTKEKPFECNVCNRTFNRKGNCIAHEKLHQISSTFYNCKHCGQTYTRLKKLKRHLRQVHKEKNLTEIEKHALVSHSQTLKTDETCDFENVASNVEIDGEVETTEVEVVETIGIWDGSRFELISNTGSPILVNLASIEMFNNQVQIIDSETMEVKGIGFVANVNDVQETDQELEPSLPVNKDLEDLAA